MRNVPPDEGAPEVHELSCPGVPTLIAATSNRKGADCCDCCAVEMLAKSAATITAITVVNRRGNESWGWSHPNRGVFELTDSFHVHMIRVKITLIRIVIEGHPAAQFRN
jgi:hypothetical protein